MSNKLQKPLLNILSAVCVTAAMSVVPVYAAFGGATLSELQISPSDSGNYQIILKTDKNASFKKYVTADNKIVIDLNNTQPAKFVNTIYKDAANVDHVIVQPTSDSSVRVFLQGQNIANSDILLSTTVAATTAPSANTVDSSLPAPVPAATTDNAQNSIVPPVVQKPEDVIVLGKPADNFKPAVDYNENSDAEQVQNSMFGGGINFHGKSYSLAALLGILGSIGLIVFGFKFLKPSKQVISISSLDSLKNRDMDLYKDLYNRNTLGGVGVGTSNSPKFNNLANRAGSGSFSNYALKEYQNSQVPMNNSSTRIQPTANIRPSRPAEYNQISAQKTRTAAPVKKAPQPIVKKQAQPELRTAQNNMNNAQFLESMAKIYEKSGRLDLARELRANMRKSQAIS